MLPPRVDRVAGSRTATRFSPRCAISPEKLDGERLCAIAARPLPGAGATAARSFATRTPSTPPTSGNRNRLTGSARLLASLLLSFAARGRIGDCSRAVPGATAPVFWSSLPRGLAVPFDTDEVPVAVLPWDGFIATAAWRSLVSGRLDAVALGRACATATDCGEVDSKVNVPATTPTRPRVSSSAAPPAAAYLQYVRRRWPRRPSSSTSARPEAGLVAWSVPRNTLPGRAVSWPAIRAGTPVNRRIRLGVSHWPGRGRRNAMARPAPAHASIASLPRCTAVPMASSRAA